MQFKVLIFVLAIILGLAAITEAKPPRGHGPARGGKHGPSHGPARGGPGRHGRGGPSRGPGKAHGRRG
ncbi:unnamed protein product [Cylicocyclus nassatus]|uniref:Uncharacterized protein n=1 Tax=Cylicocyclus nassatus TaxID=53992 RepID=A0AA36DP20_CYLNA|nr:unnamed protein product [Cylicocyclus nassatus]